MSNDIYDDLPPFARASMRIASAADEAGRLPSADIGRIVEQIKGHIRHLEEIAASPPAAVEVLHDELSVKLLQLTGAEAVSRSFADAFNALAALRSWSPEQAARIEVVLHETVAKMPMEN